MTIYHHPSRRFLVVALLLGLAVLGNLIFDPATIGSFTNAQAVPPTLGNYANKTVSVGANITVTPDAAPTNTAGITVATSTDFKGIFTADPTTGVVRVTNAYPAGTYTVTVTALNSAGTKATKTFTLTVQNSPACVAPISFTSAANVSTGSGPRFVAVGDFNGDGKLDLATANDPAGTVSIRLGNGQGGFTGTTTITVGSSPHWIAVGDFNGDGKQDIATANAGSASVSIRLGDGLGGFSGTTEVSVGSTPWAVAVGDFNGDGKQDIAAANDGASTVSIRLGDGTGNFSGTTNVSISSGATAIALGDFNGDGKLDFAASCSSSVVSIRLGDGLGGFSGTTNVSVGTNPYCLAVGDFNGDGKQDIITANNGANTVSIRLGNGLGGFSGTTNISVGTNPYGIAAGDFNGDGKQDFVVTNSNSSTVTVGLGDGLGGFSSTTNVSVGSFTTSVAVGDFNGDGKLDFANSNYSSNNVTVRLEACNTNTPPNITAAGPLTRQQDSPAGAAAQIATVSDIDQTANTLTVTATPLTGSGVTISNISIDAAGNVTANVAASCAATNSTFTLTATDNTSLTNTATLSVNVTANTAPTLVYSNPPSAAFGASLNVTPTTATDNGSVTYSVQSVSPALTTAPTVNSSGVVAITNAQPAGNHVITIHATDNCGSSTDAQFTLNVLASSLGNYPNASVNLSGNTTVTPDAAPTNTTSMTVSAPTSFKGTFAADPTTGVVRVTDAHPAGTYTVTVTALNGGSVTSSKTFTLTVQNGAACNTAILFSNASSVSTGTSTGPRFIAVGDFNNDGKQDIAVVNDSAGTVSIRLGNGSGGFTGSTNVTVGGSPHSVAIGDFNGDGKQDIAVANAATDTVSIRLGNGAGGFTGTTEISLGTGADPWSVAVGDFNGDGKQDLAIANDGGTTVSIKLGDGAGGFSGSTTVPIGFGSTAVVVGDFNGDGKLDLAVANGGSSTVSIRLGDGTGGFTGTTNISVGANPYGIALGDFNGDGKLDFATANYDANTVSIKLGDGAGGFSGSTTISVGTNPYGIAVGDFNGDGKQDIAVTNANSNSVSVRLGDGLGGFSGTTELSAGTYTTSLAVGDFNGDGKQDIVAANYSTSNVSVRLGGCDTAPTITAQAGVTRQQGAAVSNSQIATASDSDQLSNTLTVTATPLTGSGVTISSISVSLLNKVTANVVASCTATTSTFTLTVTDSQGVSSTATLTVTVTANTAPTLTYSNKTVAAGGSLTINPVTGPSDNGSVSSVVLQSQGTYTGNISVNSSGVVSISNAKPGGTHTITIRATDNCGAITDATFTLNVTCPTITLSPSSLPNNNVGASYNQTITAGGGTAAYTFTQSAGTLPTGLTLSSSGALSGTTTTAGNFSFTVTATGANGCTGSQGYSVSVNALPTITAVAPLNRQQGSAAINSVIAMVSDAEQTANTLNVTTTPLTGTGVTISNISVAANGNVTADVAASCGATNSTFTLTVTDNQSAPATAPLSVNVTANTAPTLSYASAQTVAGGGVLTINPTSGPSDNGSVSTVVVQSQGSYTGNINVNNSGVISISNAAPAGTHTITIRATDNCGTTTDVTFTLNIFAPPAFSFLYALHDTNGGNNEIYGYQVDEAIGGLTLLSGFPITTGGQGSGAAASDYLAIDAINFRLYALNSGSRTVSAFAIDPATGALTPLPFSPIALPSDIGNWMGIKVHPSGSPLLTVAGPTSPGGRVASYVITSTTATAALNSPYDTSSASPFSSAFSQDGNYFYTGGNGNSSFAAFSVNSATGVLTALAGSPFSATNTPTAYATDVLGRLFMAQGSSVDVFTTSSGMPTGVSGNPFSAGLGFGALGLIHPNGFYFVVDRSNNQVAVFQIQGNDAATTLSSVNGSPFATGGGLSEAAVLNQIGNFLFIANGSSRNLTTFVVDGSTGILSSPIMQAANTLGASGILNGLAYLPGSAFTLKPSSLPDGTVSAAYNQSLTPSGGLVPYTFSVTAGTLPAGLSLDSGGSLSGTPTQSGSFNFTVTARDAFGSTGSRGYTLTINCPQITINQASLLGGIVGASYSQNLTASGGTSSYTFSVTAGALPGGLSLSNGVLSGTLTASGTFNFTITARDFYGCTGSQAYSVTIDCPSITITQTSLPGGGVGTTYSQALTPSGGAAPYSFTVTGLPDGLSYNSSTTDVTINGIPSQGGSFSVNVNITDGYGCQGSRSYTLAINAKPTIIPAAALTRQQGSPAVAAAPLATVNDAETTVSNLTVAVITGGTATGLTIGSLTNTNGAITATVAAGCGASSGTVRLQVTDGGGLTATAEMQVNVTANTPPTLTYATPQVVMVGGSLMVNPTSGPSDNGSISNMVVQSVTPAGFTGTVNVNSSGVVSISNAGPSGSFTITIRATDNCGTITDVSFTLVNNRPPVASCQNVSVIVGAGGTAAASINNGSYDPDGDALTITQTPPGPYPLGSKTVTLTATDSHNAASQCTATVTVVCPTVSFTPSTLESGRVGSPYSQTITPSGGTTPYTFNVTGLPPGLTASATATNVTLSGVPTQPGSFNITVTATSASGCLDSRAYTLSLGVSGDVRFSSDFDGDGKTDLAIWRPSTATFYIYSPAANTTFTKQWGNSTDVPVPADYDGDGKTDIAVWRPSTGTWLILNSSNGATVTLQWGSATDVPVPGDYDGDRKTDLAIWRPSTGNWMIFKSSGGTMTMQWGTPGDVPLPGDYDGDGKTDLAIWRPSTATFYIYSPAASTTTTKQWGSATDVPVPADYDGDGKTDIAVWRPSTGAWLIFLSSNGTTPNWQWGLSTDVPVPGDYDGDGKTDLAIWRPSTGNWMIFKSSGGTMTMQWGTSGDVPVR